ncbi:MAG: alcohol acetyltransferase [Canibacter sp.]
MSQRSWVRLDNASNIFLAARTESDPKVFRLSAEVDHEVDRAILQTAVDHTYDRYRLYHAVLRRAIFWHYLQDSDLRPKVTLDDKPTCAPIYEPDRHNLLFRVRYFHERIILETFHALSDGTGALWFLTDVVTEYFRLYNLAEQNLPDEAQALHTAELGTVPRIVGREDVDERDAEETRALASDSFSYYFRRKTPRRAEAGESEFQRAAEIDIDADDASQEHPETQRLTLRQRLRLQRVPGRKVHRVKGTRTPDNRTRAVELTMPVADVLALARAEGVSLTMYLTALFFESVRKTSGGLGKATTLSASVPVNLRQFFPSQSPRNFFATVRVQHTYGDNVDDLGTIARGLERQFRPRASRAALDKKLRRFIRFERMPALRVVPRPLKDVLLRFINWVNNRGLTIAVSNLGRVVLPETIDARVSRTTFHVSAVRPQMCAISHAGFLTVTFTSPFVETHHIREFARMLTSQDISVTVSAARVTETELTEEGKQ